MYKARKQMLFLELLTTLQHTPLARMTFPFETLYPYADATRRVGRPKMNWTTETSKELWKIGQENAIIGPEKIFKLYAKETYDELKQCAPTLTRHLLENTR